MPPHFHATCLAILADAELALNKLHLARQHLLEAMTVMLKSQIRLLINCYRVLYTWAELLAKECDRPEAAQQPLITLQKQAYALEILFSIIYQPVVSHFYTMRAKQFAAKLAMQLPGDLAAAAEARGKLKTWPQLATEISQIEALPSGETDLNPLHRHSAR